MNTAPPIALTIAGSDCSGGAGLQADLKTFQSFGVHGLSALTSVVAESPLEVRQVEPISIPLLQDQINILIETYPITAIKIGLLPSRCCVIAVTESIRELNIPIVIDPVMVSSTGNQLTDDETSTTFIQRLLPMATLITPNIPEAELILGERITNKESLESAAQKIAEKLQTSCLIKGGHLSNEDELLDVLWHHGNPYHFKHTTIPLRDMTKGIHGTGCALSSAIAAGLAQGNKTEEAVSSGINFVQQLIQNAHTWQLGDQQVQGLGW